MISKIYSSKLPYQWRAGQYKPKSHKKAVKRMPKKPKLKGVFDK